MTTYQEQINALAERVRVLEAERDRLQRHAQASAAREPHPDDAPLFEALREWRAQRAEVGGIPAFRIFGNAALTAIATAKPADRYELVRIKGVGEQKLADYGDEVIAIVRSYMDGDW